MPTLGEIAGKHRPEQYRGGPLESGVQGFFGVEPDSVMEMDPRAYDNGRLLGLISDLWPGKGALTAGIAPAMKLAPRVESSLARLIGGEARKGDVSRVMLSLQERNLPPEILERAKKHEAASKGFAEARPYLAPDELAKAARSNVTPQKYDELMTTLPPVDEMMAVARAGEAKRGWYGGSRRASDFVYGPDAQKMAYLKAALSPQTSVEGNLDNALSMFSNWDRAGRPTDGGTIRRLLGESVQQQPLDQKPRMALQQLAQRFGLDPNAPTADLVAMLSKQDPAAIREASVLGAWVPNTERALNGETLLSGPKVDSFAANLDPTNRYAPLHFTNDTWMARYGGIPQATFSGSLNKVMGEPGYSPGYSAYSARGRAAADQMGWSPDEVQETIWSWAKPVGEGAGKVGIVVPPEVINSVPDFQTLLQNDRYMTRMTPEQRARAEMLPQAFTAPDQPYKPSRRDRVLLEQARKRVIDSYLKDKGAGE